MSKKRDKIVDLELIDKEKALDTQLLENKIKLQTEIDLPNIYYVKTLELIRDIVILLRDNEKPLPDEFYRHYDLVLSEIEPAIDDLTLDSLSLVIEQYKDIVEIDRGLNFSKHYQLKNNRVVRKLKMWYNLSARYERRKLESSLYGVTLIHI